MRLYTFVLFTDTTYPLFHNTFAILSMGIKIGLAFFKTNQCKLHPFELTYL